MHFLTRTTLAALALSSGCAVLAQDSLTIYGRINTSLEHQTVGGRSLNAMVNNNARIGFFGREDLGQGLRAGFELEAGFQSDTGAGMLSDGGLSFGRKSNVSLGGNWGQLKLGRAGGSSYDFVADYGVLDQPNHDTGSVSDALYYDIGRSTNGIAYTTPTIAGLVVVAALSLHEKDPASDRTNNMDLAANWGSGPWSVGAGYTRRGDNRQWGLRVHYMQGAIQLGAYYQRANDASWGSACNHTASAGCGTRQSARVNAMYTVGASEWVVGYGWAGDWGQQRNSGARQLILGYNYHLSKRTKVYALFTQYHNDTHARYGYGFKGGVGVGEDARTFGVGVRHAF